MIYINEWLPNPIGKDSQGKCPVQDTANCGTTGEWVELFNSGSAPISLSSWRLVSKSGRQFVLSSQTVEPQGFLVLDRSATKLIFKNTADGLALYNAQGALVDQSSFPGTAPSGQSLSRTGDRFIFTKPTPGAPNQDLATTALLSENYSAAGQLTPGVGLGPASLWALGAALLVTLAVFIIVKKDHAISQLLFPRN